MRELAAVCLLLIPASVFAGPISVTVQPPDVVYDAVFDGVDEWARDPLGTCTGSQDNQCCTGAAVDAECKVIATNTRTSPNFWVRLIYGCLAQNGNWECDTFQTARGERGMYCETVPNAATVLADVADCLSAEAARAP